MRNNVFHAEFRKLARLGDVGEHDVVILTPPHPFAQLILSRVTIIMRFHIIRLIFRAIYISRLNIMNVYPCNAFVQKIFTNNIDKTVIYIT